MDIEVSPRYPLLMAKHSICHPGLPCPRDFPRQVLRVWRISITQNQKDFVFFHQYLLGSELHILELATGKFSIFIEFFNRIINIPVYPVCKTF